MSDFDKVIDYSFYYPYHFDSPFAAYLIPKDLQKNFGGKDEFRLSLRYVINGDTKILCLKLKEITDKLFTEIRSGMKKILDIK